MNTKYLVVAGLFAFAVARCGSDEASDIGADALDSADVAIDGTPALDAMDHAPSIDVPTSDHAIDVFADADHDVAMDTPAHDVASDVHCTAPEQACDGTCVNISTDATHCGSCAHACVSGAFCLSGECSLDRTCPPVHYPNVTIQSVPSATMTAAYASIVSGTCYPSPPCFLDLSDLRDPDTGASIDVHTLVSPHFELYELVATEIAGGYTHYAIVSPSLVTHLEDLRAAEGGNPLTIVSGYRSPQHQAATCASICAGGASCCPSAAHPCGCRSEHEWGRAADLGIPSSEYTAYGNDSQSVHFPDCLLEAGSFHVDVSPCPLGCPYNF